MYCKQTCMSHWKIIVCDKLEWERKMEEQDFHAWYESSKVLKLVNLCGTQNGKQNCKKNWEQDIHGWHEGFNIYKRLVQLVMRFIWQAKVMWMRHNMLLHSLKMGWLVIWDEYCCQGKQTREKWMRHELMCICCLKLESLHMKLNGESILIKKISCMTQNQCELQNV